jgi:glycosyltransferase involved in cell wall biosynthesis/nucleotide-binding universal stress UspA family protein
MKRPFTPFRKLLVPIMQGIGCDSALAVARLMIGQPTPGRQGGRIVLVGLVGIAPEDSLSSGALPARRVRAMLRQLGRDERFRSRDRIRVSYTPWAELVSLIQEERPDLLLLEWPHHFEAFKVAPADVLASPPCDVALVRGPLPENLMHVLLPIRGGPYSELALRLSLVVTAGTGASLISLHVRPEAEPVAHDALYRGIERVLRGLPEVTSREMATRKDDMADTIIAQAHEFDLVVMGAAARPAPALTSLGPVTDRVLSECTAGVVVVKTRRPVPAVPESEVAGAEAISILVDKWFAENTFHAREFADLNHLLALKHKQALTISLALPALNEEATVGKVIQTVKQALMDQVPLLDEIVLIDSDSTDRTREIAADLGVPVFIHQEILPAYGVRAGKGEALWKSLYVTRGDLVVWIDTDIVNIHPRFVYGVLGPLLVNPRIQFVKGFYRRPLKVGDRVQAGGGGRVTELTARPLLNLFYPELSGLVQPLSGEYGGRRAALERLPFYCGYGVETGLLIDVLEKYRLPAIAQVDLVERVHHNQPLEALSKMSFAIIQAVIHKLEHRYERAFLDDVNKTMKLIRYGVHGYSLEVVEIIEKERPPMIEIPEYQAR